MDAADRPRPRRRPAPVRRAPARASGYLDRAAPLAAEPDGRRRHAHPQALPRGSATRRLRAHRARSGADADPRRARPLGLRVGLEPAPRLGVGRPRRDLQARSRAHPRPAATGTVEFERRRTRTAAAAYTFTVAEDSVAVEERSADGADARVIGPTAGVGQGVLTRARPQRPRAHRRPCSSPATLLDGLARRPVRAPRRRAGRAPRSHAEPGSLAALLVRVRRRQQVRDLTRLRARQRRRHPARLLGPGALDGIAVAGGRAVAARTGVLAVPRREVALGEVRRRCEPDRRRVGVRRGCSSRGSARTTASPDPTGENWRR